MENNQLLPFERNRYYVGKLLTSADFLAEQVYGNHKRRFLNEMMFGSGIVCGLGVYSLDDQSVMIDSGVAVDGYGREIVLENSVVKKLSSIDGFEGLAGEDAVLCLAFREEPVQPVYAVRGQENGESYEHNRIREGWRLLLCDRDTLAAIEQPPELEFLSTGLLYEDDDYEISFAVPGQCPCGIHVRMDVTVLRKNPEAQPISLRAVIQAPSLLTEEGGHELLVELQDVAVEGSLTLHYWLKAQSRPAAEGVLMAEPADVTVHIGDRPGDGVASLLLRSAVVELPADRIVDRAAASTSLEARQMSGQELVPLEEIRLQRTRRAYLIEHLDADRIRSYIRTTASDSLRRELREWFREDQAGGAMQTVERCAPAEPERFTEPLYATGTCEIPLPSAARRGQVAYSDEIVHGLGSKTVFVSVGTEYLSDDPKLGVVARSTIYGNVHLFPKEAVGQPRIETAVKVHNDRGSFVVAAQLQENTTQVILKLRWVAVALQNDQEKTRIQKIAGKSITAVQPTVVMATRESHFFNVRFRNMEPCTLTYELTEKDSGEITSDGIYTAPGREGVFEIRISCADMPLLSTYAYAVVKKRDSEQENN